MSFAFPYRSELEIEVTVTALVKFAQDQQGEIHEEGCFVKLPNGAIEPCGLEHFDPATRKQMIENCARHAAFDRLREAAERAQSRVKAREIL